MRNIVKVTRRGQTTIPALFRREFGIKEGDELVVEVTKEGLLFRVIPKLEELAGAYSKYGNVEEMKQEIEKLREEY
jgi:AbrB family looped-hinge helix DNA binding protein